MRGRWYQNPLFKRYWHHYHNTLIWFQHHQQLLRDVAAQSAASSDLQVSQAGQDYRFETPEDGDFEMPVTEELIAFFEQSARHRKSLVSHLVGNVSDLAVAGTLTTTTTLQWHLVQLALQPSGLQSQLQRELDAAVGRERPPAWEDRGRMPFTVAAIWEMYRWKVATPLGLPREAAEDTYVGKHFVPKGTVILANMWAAHMNPDRWQHPEKFHPARFLKPDGSAPLARPANMFPFGVGKRMCPGEPLAQAAVFLYLTSLLQKYRILPEEGSQLDIGGVFPSKVAAVKLRFLPR